MKEIKNLSFTINCLSMMKRCTIRYLMLGIMAVIASTSVFAQTTYVNTTMKKQPWAQLPVVLANEAQGGLHTLEEDLSSTTIDASYLNGRIPASFRELGMLVTIADNSGSTLTRTFKYVDTDEWNEVYLTTVWNADESYAAGQPVVYANNVYVAAANLVAGVEPTVSTGWETSWVAAGSDLAFANIDSLITEVLNLGGTFATGISNSIGEGDTLAINMDSLVTQFAVSKFVKAQIDSLKKGGAYYDSIITQFIYSDTIITHKLETDTVISKLILVDSIYAEIGRIDTLFSHIISADSIFSEVARIDSIFSNFIQSDTIYSQIIRADSIYSELARIDSIFSHFIQADTIYSQIIRADSIYAQYAHFDSLIADFFRVDSLVTQIVSADSIYSELARIDSIFSNFIQTDTVYSQIVRADSIYSEIARIDSIFSNFIQTDTIYSQIIRADSIYSEMARIDSIYSEFIRVDSIYAETARIDTLFSHIIDADSIFSEIARIDSIFSQFIQTDSIYSELARIDSIYSEFISVDSIYATMAQIDTLHSNVITADSIFSVVANIDTLVTKAIIFDSDSLLGVAKGFNGSTSNDSLITQKAVKDYVDAQIAAIDITVANLEIYFGQVSSSAGLSSFDDIIAQSSFSQSDFLNLGSTGSTAFDATGYVLSKGQFNYIAYPAAWAETPLFMAYDMDATPGYESVSRVIDGWVKRVVDVSIGGETISYQVWIYGFQIPVTFSGTVKLTDKMTTAGL